MKKINFKEVSPLRIYRKYLNKTQAALAEETKTSQTTIIRAEKGENISVYSAIRIAKAVGVNITDFIDPDVSKKVLIDRAINYTSKKRGK